MEITPVGIWIAIGLLSVLVELTTMPGIGFLFLGLGSPSTAITICCFPEIASFQVASVGHIKSFIELATLAQKST